MASVTAGEWVVVMGLSFPSDTPSDDAGGRFVTGRPLSGLPGAGGLPERRLFGQFGIAPVAALDPPHEDAGHRKQRNDDARNEDEELVESAEPGAVMQRPLPGDDRLAGRHRLRVEYIHDAAAPGIDQHGHHRRAIL